MSISIGLRETNQHLSRYIEAVEKGEEVLITKRGKLVAKLIGIGKKIKLSKEKEAALKRTAHRMRKGLDVDAAHFNRDSLYER